ncbi:MAG TPA: MFS transporter [Candidatus Sumerlaeia bacterium]|nr:MFS transporter [Candidatus Sumerlaeia bacterium]
MKTRERFIEFFGLKRSIIGILSVVILVEMGERMGERFLPIYIMALGGGAIAVGLVNALDNLLSALYSFPGGYLSDRLGTRRALLIFNLMAIAGFLIVVFAPRWEAILAGAALFISWSAISLPATMGLVSRALPKTKRTMGVSLHSLTRRIPMALGPIVGGFFIYCWGERDGIRYAFTAAIAMTVLAIFLQQVMIEDKPSDKSANVEKNPFKLMREMSPSLRNLLLSDILIRFCEQIPYAFVVVWAMKIIEHPVSAPQFGYLSAIEMATAMLIYIPVAYFADKAGKKPFVAMTFIFFTLFPLALYFCRSFWALVGGFILRGLKEFGEPTRKALIMDLAPESRKAAMFGLYYLMRDVIVSIGAFGGAFLWQTSPQLNLFVAFGFGVFGTLWFIFRGEDLRKS